MKSTVAPWQRILWCLRVEPVYGSDLQFAFYPHDVTMSNGEIYTKADGQDFSGTEFRSDFSPTSIDIAGFLSSNGISKADIAAGTYDNARWYLFNTDWDNPVEDEEPMSAGLFGASKIVDSEYEIEMMTLVDVLNQKVGLQAQQKCPRVFGDSGCTVDVDALAVAATVTSVTDASNFVISATSEADDYFGLGKLQFTDGENANLRPAVVKEHTTGGNITLFDPLPYTPEVGDALSVKPGCRKRHIEDCKNKYNNVRNFLGFPWVPTDDVTKSRGKRT
jgi:uncharacterized phage protein (TIGR02218 family)